MTTIGLGLYAVAKAAFEEVQHADNR